MTGLTIQLADPGASSEPDAPGYRPGERIAGQIVLGALAPPGELVVELRNLESGGLIRDEASIRAETTVKVESGQGLILFGLMVPVDAVPGFTTEVPGPTADGLGAVTRTWQVHARYGGNETSVLVSILPAQPGVPAEELVSPDFAVPALSINGPPGRRAAAITAAIPALLFIAAAGGAMTGLFSPIWLIFPGAALLVGMAVSAAITLERRSQRNLDYGQTNITLDRAVYRLGEPISALISVDTGLPVRAVLELVEVRPVRRQHMVNRAGTYIDDDVTFSMWSTSPTTLKRGENQVTWIAPAGQPASYRGPRTGLAWIVQVLAETESIHRHFPRVVAVIRP